jgi:hypothetical protein
MTSKNTDLSSWDILYVTYRHRQEEMDLYRRPEIQCTDSLERWLAPGRLQPAARTMVSKCNFYTSHYFFSALSVVRLNYYTHFPTQVHRKKTWRLSSSDIRIILCSPVDRYQRIGETCSTLKTNVAKFSETLVTVHQFTQRHIFIVIAGELEISQKDTS